MLVDLHEAALKAAAAGHARTASRFAADVSRADDPPVHRSHGEKPSALSTCCSAMPAISVRWRRSDAYPEDIFDAVQAVHVKGAFSPANTPSCLI
ncbi:MAG: hypothetical protein R3D52_03370 [Xanthobacteraceae bacterium]